MAHEEEDKVVEAIKEEGADDECSEEERNTQSD